MWGRCHETVIYAVEWIETFALWMSDASGLTGNGLVMCVRTFDTNAFDKVFESKP